MLAIYRKNQDLIHIGAYPAGTNVAIDRAIQLHEPLRQFLRQAAHEGFAAHESWGMLGRTMAKLNEPRPPVPTPSAPPPPTRRSGAVG
jgi:flagellum-specific ATP synthase